MPILALEQFGHALLWAGVVVVGAFVMGMLGRLLRG